MWPCVIPVYGYMTMGIARVRGSRARVWCDIVDGLPFSMSIAPMRMCLNVMSHIAIYGYILWPFHPIWVYSMIISPYMGILLVNSPAVSM